MINKYTYNFFKSSYFFVQYQKQTDNVKVEWLTIHLNNIKYLRTVKQTENIDYIHNNDGEMFRNIHWMFNEWKSGYKWCSNCNGNGKQRILNWFNHYNLDLENILLEEINKYKKDDINTSSINDTTSTSIDSEILDNNTSKKKTKKKNGEENEKRES